MSTVDIPAPTAASVSATSTASKMSNNVAIKKLYIVLKITTLNRFLSFIMPRVVSAIRDSIIMFR